MMMLEYQMKCLGPRPPDDAKVSERASEQAGLCSSTLDFTLDKYNARSYQRDGRMDGCDVYEENMFAAGHLYPTTTTMTSQETSLPLLSALALAPLHSLNSFIHSWRMPLVKRTAHAIHVRISVRGAKYQAAVRHGGPVSNVMTRRGHSARTSYICTILYSLQKKSHQE